MVNRMSWIADLPAAKEVVTTKLSDGNEQNIQQHTNKKHRWIKASIASAPYSLKRQMHFQVSRLLAASCRRKVVKIADRTCNPNCNQPIMNLERKMGNAGKKLTCTIGGGGLSGRFTLNNARGGQNLIAPTKEQKINK
jgi:hypothetical protein